MPGMKKTSRKEHGWLDQPKNKDGLFDFQQITSDYFPCFFSIFVQVSRKVTVRLKTSSSAVVSESTQK
jgi:hypothetical protein